MDYFTIIFPDRHASDHVGRCSLPWRSGKQLRHYIRESPLGGMSLVGYSLRCKIYNSKKQSVRLTYVPVPNDFVVFVPASRK